MKKRKSWTERIKAAFGDSEERISPPDLEAEAVRFDEDHEAAPEPAEVDTGHGAGGLFDIDFDWGD